MSDSALLSAPLQQLINDCRQVSSSGQAPEQGPCYELFRRALSLKDPDAWGAIERQYRPMLARWLRARSLAENDIDDLAQEALTRFWLTLSRHPEALTERFLRVPALLRYLHQCAASAHLDRLRQGQQRRRLQDRCQEIALDAPHSSALESLLREEELNRIRTWIQRNVTDTTELLVLRGTIDEGLSPQEVQRRHPEVFPDTATVHRLKERILKRARRAFLGNPSPDDPSST